MYIIDKKTGKQILYIDGDELNILDNNFVATDNQGVVIEQEAQNAKTRKSSDEHDRKN